MDKLILVHLTGLSFCWAQHLERSKREKAKHQKARLLVPNTQRKMSKGLIINKRHGVGYHPTWLSKTSRSWAKSPLVVSLRSLLVGEGSREWRRQRRAWTGVWPLDRWVASWCWGGSQKGHLKRVVFSIKIFCWPSKPKAIRPSTHLKERNMTIQRAEGRNPRNIDTCLNSKLQNSCDNWKTC